MKIYTYIIGVLVLWLIGCKPDSHLTEETSTLTSTVDSNSLNHSANQQSFDLSIKPPPGAEYHYTLSMIEHITQQIGGKMFDTDKKIIYGIQCLFMERDSKRITRFRIVYDRINFDMTSPAGHFTYDSQKPTRDIAPLARIYAALQGGSFDLTMDPTGDIKFITGYDKFIDLVSQRLSGQDDSMKRLMIRDFPHELGEQNAKEFYQMIFHIYPDNGSTYPEGQWNHTYTTSITLPCVAPVTYTITGLSKGVAMLNFSGNMLPNPSGEVNKSGGRYTLNGLLTGTVQLDTLTGMIKSYSVLRDLKGSINHPPSPQAGEGLIVPITVRSEIKLEQN